MVSTVKGIKQDMPVGIYSEKEILKDSKIWDYLQYLQLNRINFISTEVFNEHNKTANQLYNLISAVDQFEFLMWDKLRKSSEYLANKPELFKDMQNNPPSQWNLRKYIDGDSYTQLALKIKCTQWLKAMSPSLGSMKSVKRVDFVAGEGFMDDEKE